LILYNSIRNHQIRTSCLGSVKAAQNNADNSQINERAEHNVEFVVTGAPAAERLQAAEENAQRRFASRSQPRGSLRLRFGGTTGAKPHFSANARILLSHMPCP
jgi:hypothetical protein